MRRLLERVRTPTRSQILRLNKRNVFQRHNAKQALRAGTDQTNLNETKN